MSRDTATGGPMSDERERVRLRHGDDTLIDVSLPAAATPEMVEAFRALCVAATKYLRAALEAR